MKKILLIDDDSISHFITTRQIQNLNKEIETIAYTDPVAAFENLSALNPDLILLDLNMPIMDGFKFLQKMRELSLRHPVYVVTSSAFREDKDKVMQYKNVKRLLVKPLSAQIIAEILDYGNVEQEN